jgi:hypothetical protein
VRRAGDLPKLFSKPGETLEKTMLDPKAALPHWGEVTLDFRNFLTASAGGARLETLRPAPPPTEFGKVRFGIARQS